MKRFLILLCLVLALPFVGAWAEDDGMVTFGNVSVQKYTSYVDMGGQIVSDWEAFYSFLSQLPDVEKVDMFATTVEKKDIAQLEARFPDIKFGWTIHITRAHYIRTDQTAFSTLHGSCNLHTSKELEVLKYCTELIALDIGHNDLTDISFLENLTKLRVLIIAINPELRSIEPLRNLKDLEYLEVFSCKIRDLSPLKDLPHLMDLNIAYNERITDYSVLYEMPQLKRLWMPQIGVPVYKKDLAKLQEALPNTTIMNSGHPTANGWREGNHYETIYAMFRADEYMPFEDSYPLGDEDMPTENDIVPLN